MDGYKVDSFLANLPEEELSGRHLSFDIPIYVLTAKAQPVRAKHKELS